MAQVDEFDAEMEGDLQESQEELQAAMVRAVQEAQKVEEEQGDQPQESGNADEGEDCEPLETEVEAKDNVDAENGNHPADGEQSEEQEGNGENESKELARTRSIEAGAGREEEGDDREDVKPPKTPSQTGSGKAVSGEAVRLTNIESVLGQVKMMMTRKIAAMFGRRWPKRGAEKENLIKDGAPEARVNLLEKMTEQDIESGLAQALSFVTFSLGDRPENAVGICRVLRQVRDNALKFEADKGEGLASQQGKSSTKIFVTETGTRVEEVLFSVLGRVLSESRLDLESASADEQQDVKVWVDIAFAHFSACHKECDARSLHKTVRLIRFLSYFDLEQTLKNFRKKMSKVYFHASALDYVPFMKVCATSILFSLRSDTAVAACKEFLASLVKLLKTTSCVELIEESFRCIVFMMNQFHEDRVNPQRPTLELESDGSVSPSFASSRALHHRASSFNSKEQQQINLDVSDDLEQLYSIAHGYCSRKKFVTPSLSVMEAILGWETESEMEQPTLPSQFERLSEEVIKRVKDGQSRISGLDHLQRFLGVLPLVPKPSASRDIQGGGSSALDSVPTLLFQANSIPRAQEAALISSVLVELGKREYLTPIFDECIHIGLESEKATSAQRASCLNALASIGRFFKSKTSRANLERFISKNSRSVVRFAAREMPPIIVTEALACYPVMGEQSKEILQLCVDCAFGFDPALVDSGRDALIRFCQLGKIFAEKAILAVVESPNLRLISTYQESGIARDTAQLLSSVSTLEMVLSAALEKGFQSTDLIEEAGSTLLLATTYPDEKVRVHAHKVLLMLQSVEESLDGAGSRSEKGIPRYSQRAIDKLILGLLGQGGSESCGGKRAFDMRSKVLARQGFGDPLVWWEAQCAFVCSSSLTHSNKPTFVKALVQECITAVDADLQMVALSALSSLTSMFDVVDKQLTLQTIQTQESGFNEILIRILSAFHHRYQGTELEPRVHDMVEKWILTWSEDSSRHAMKLWSEPALEAAAELFRSYVLNGSLDRFEDPSASRDNGVFLIREWCRTRDRVMRASRVPDAFMALLNSGNLKGVEAQAYALKMLSAFSGFKEYQSEGLKALLDQNLKDMLDFFLETILCSFNPTRWENEPRPKAVTVPLDDRHPFARHVVSALLDMLNERGDEIEAPKVPQVLLLVCLLFVHQVPEIRAMVHQWSFSSQFLHLPHPDFGPSFLSQKLGGITKAVYVSEFIARHQDGFKSKGVNIDTIVVAAHEMCETYLNDRQVSQVVLMLEPWLCESFPEKAVAPQNIVILLAHLFTRVQPTEVVTWRVWRNPCFAKKALGVTVEALVTFLIDAEPGADLRAPHTAIKQIAIASVEMDGVDVLSALVACMPKVDWEVAVMPESRNKTSGQHETQAHVEDCCRETEGCSHSKGSEHVHTHRCNGSEGHTQSQCSDHGHDHGHSHHHSHHTYSGEQVDGKSKDTDGKSRSNSNHQLDKTPKRSRSATSSSRRRARAVLSLMSNAPFLLHEWNSEDLAQALYLCFVEEGIESNLSQRAMEAITEEIPVASGLGEKNESPQGRGWFACILENSSDTIGSLTLRSSHCILYSKLPAKRARSFLVLQSVGMNNLEPDLLTDLVDRAHFVCVKEIKRLSELNGPLTVSEINFLSHLMVLLELVSSSQISIDSKRVCTRIASNVLLIPFASRKNLFGRIRASCVKVLNSVGSNGNDGARILAECFARTDVPLQSLTLSLADEEVAIAASKVIAVASSILPSSGERVVAYMCILAAAAMAAFQGSSSGKMEKDGGSEIGGGASLEFDVEKRIQLCRAILHVVDEESEREDAEVRRKVRQVVEMIGHHCDSVQGKDDSESAVQFQAGNLDDQIGAQYVQSFLRLDPSPTSDDLGGMVMFFVNFISYGSTSWVYPAMKMISELCQHSEVVSLCLERESDLLFSIHRSLVCSMSELETHRISALHTLDSLPKKNDPDLSFMRSTGLELTAEQSSLKDGLIACFERLRK